MVKISIGNVEQKEHKMRAGLCTLEIAYYANISALSDSNTSNWLLEAHPEAFLYGCLSEAFKYGMDEEQATKYHNLFNEVIQQMRTLDAKRKYSQDLTVRVA